MKQTDEEIIKLHGDHPVYSIRNWRHEIKLRLTKLEYIDWRADKMWCHAQDRQAARR